MCIRLKQSINSTCILLPIIESVCLRPKAYNKIILWRTRKSTLQLIIIKPHLPNLNICFIHYLSHFSGKPANEILRKGLKDLNIVCEHVLRTFEVSTCTSVHKYWDSNDRADSADPDLGLEIVSTIYSQF